MTSTPNRPSCIDRLTHHLRHRAGAPAFTLDDETWTFGDVDHRARCYARGVRDLGLERGDRVVVILETSLQLVSSLMGHYALGAVHVPVNTRYGEVEIAHILEDSGARFALVDSPEKLAMLRDLRARGVGQLDGVIRLADAATLAPEPGEHDISALMSCSPLEQVERVEDEDLAMFIYTSGTTGKSKGVALPYRAIVSGIDSLTTLWRWREEDELILALPLFHVHGLGIGIHGTLLKGCHAVMHARFDARRVVEAMCEGGTIFMGVPTMYARLVKYLGKNPAASARLRASDARLFTSGSAALSAARFEEFESLSGHRILERYGMSETMLTVSNPYEPARRKPGTIGFPVPGCEVEIRDESMQLCAPGEVGQIVVKGPSVMREYWRAPEKTAEAFDGEWFLTGDAARYDEEGYIVHVGRRSVDILKSGGYKISAREIEEVLLTHPDIEEAAVVGIEDEEWGQRIGAALVVSSDAERGADWWRERVSDFVSGSLADYKRPREVVLLDALPRNALGKIQKHRIAFP